MKRWTAIVVLLAVAAGCQKNIPIRPDVADLHRQFTVIDLHVDSPMVARFVGYDYGERHRGPGWFFPWMLHTDLPRLEEAGVNGLLFGIVVNPKSGDPAASVDRQVAWIRREIIGRYPDRITIPQDIAGWRQAMSEGKIAAWMSLEGAHELGGSLDHLERWYRLGVRSVTLAHFTNNEFAATSADSSPDRPGLSTLGRRLVCEANRLGIVLDIAHTHPTSFREVLERSVAPVIVSHTGAADQLDVFRNLSEAQIRAVAARGGVIGAIFAGFWINQKRWASMDDLADLIDIIYQQGGPDAVAIGSDFDGFIWTPRGLRDAAALPALTQKLLERGYSQEDLRKLWGENALRVFDRVEAVARQLQKEGATCSSDGELVRGH
ncbi:MAG: peptidase [Candidatus Dadabacteria bacterium]|nr:MAG: peptidase [Candidatus Dadabacteria bacterium]